ncbi:hypothetical protein CR513_21838, partial [Mucuna pruriens]
MKTYHPKQQILGDVQDKVRTRSTFKDQTQFSFLFELEPKSINDASLVEAMLEDLDQFQKNDVWKLAFLPKDKSNIGTKWAFINKLDENGKFVRNKDGLKGIDFTGTFAPVARLEAIPILSFAAHNHMRLHQMDVRCDLLNDIINEEVYVKQPLGFESDAFPNHVFQLKKSLYRLKQETRAWYEKLSFFVMKNDF